MFKLICLTCNVDAKIKLLCSLRENCDNFKTKLTLNCEDEFMLNTAQNAAYRGVGILTITVILKTEIFILC